MFSSLDNVVNFLISIAGICCTLMLVVCIYKAMTGEESESNSARKRAKNSIIALIIIIMIFPIKALIINYFPESNLSIGNPTTQGENGQPIFAGLKDEDCQKREIINYEGVQYVVTDKFKDGESAIGVEYSILKESINVEKGTEVKALRLFADCQGFGAGFFADIKGYNINGTTYIISRLSNPEGKGGAFSSGGGNGGGESSGGGR